MVIVKLGSRERNLVYSKINESLCIISLTGVHSLTSQTSTMTCWISNDMWHCQSPDLLGSLFFLTCVYKFADYAG